MASFKKVLLITSMKGTAEFREEDIDLSDENPQVCLSEIMPGQGIQFRQSPQGFRSQVHVTTQAQWVFILSGEMEIGLLDGSSRRFSAGQHFYSADTLPAGVEFDPAVHGHWSRQVGDQPLVTAFVKG